MAKPYDQYCPVAHALDMVGERWALLIVRELLGGPQRYTDLAAHLPGIGTNILAARLKDLEASGVVAKRWLPPPAASQVYELTPYGAALKSVMRELAVWGIRSLGAPSEADEPAAGWLLNALDTVFAPVAPPGRFGFHIGDEQAAIVDGEARAGSIDDPDVLVEADVVSFYHLFVEGRPDGVRVEGDRALLARLVDCAVAPATPAPGSRPSEPAGTR
jgi:DNA-binding HxlR family transcriptional regulator